MAEGATPIRRLIGIYDADAGLTGELRYGVWRLRGRAHCALCDITHGSLRESSAFRRCRARIGVPIKLVHRDEHSVTLGDLSPFEPPCVLAEAAGAFVCLLRPADLMACHGDVDAFERAVHDAALRAGFALP